MGIGQADHERSGKIVSWKKPFFGIKPLFVGNEMKEEKPSREPGWANLTTMEQSRA